MNDFKKPFLIVLTGLPGVGKTTLGDTEASQEASFDLAPWRSSNGAKMVFPFQSRE